MNYPANHASLNLIMMLGISLLLSSCLFNEPVFTKDLAKVDERLTGIWVAQEKEGDPRTSQYAVLVPIDESRYLLHHPARSQDSFYYEARALKRRDRTLMQLRVLSTFKGGVPKSGSRNFTLLWIQPKANGRLLVRAADGEGGLSSMTPEEAQRRLENPSSDWDLLFAEGREYRRLE